MYIHVDVWHVSLLYHTFKRYDTLHHNIRLLGGWMVTRADASGNSSPGQAGTLLSSRRAFLTPAAWEFCRVGCLQISQEKLAGAQRCFKTWLASPNSKVSKISTHVCYRKKTCNKTCPYSLTTAIPHSPSTLGTPDTHWTGWWSATNCSAWLLRDWSITFSARPTANAVSANDMQLLWPQSAPGTHCAETSGGV